MILTRIALLAIVLAIVFVQRNFAATKVLYELHIRDKHTERNETILIRDNNIEANTNTTANINATDPATSNDNEPELVVIGVRKTTLAFVIKNMTEHYFRETTIYTADKDGYKAKFNFSLRQPVSLEPRLGAQTLKTTVG